MLRLILAVIVLLHGLGHILFLGPSLRLVDWAGQTSHSWLLTSAVGDGVARAAAAVTWVTTMALFSADRGLRRGCGVLAAGHGRGRGDVHRRDRPLLEQISRSSAVWSFMLNVLLLVVLLVLHWPATDTVAA